MKILASIVEVCTSSLIQTDARHFPSSDELLERKMIRWPWHKKYPLLSESNRSDPTRINDEAFSAKWPVAQQTRRRLLGKWNTVDRSTKVQSFKWITTRTSFRSAGCGGQALRGYKLWTYLSKQTDVCFKKFRSASVFGYPTTCPGSGACLFCWIQYLHNTCGHNKDVHFSVLVKATQSGSYFLMVRSSRGDEYGLRLLASTMLWEHTRTVFLPRQRYTRCGISAIMLSGPSENGLVSAESI